MSFALPSTETDVPELLRLRRVASQGFIGVLWALLALNTAVSFLTGMSVGVSFFISLFGAVVGTAAYFRDRDGLIGRLTIAICLMDDYDVLIYATSYTPYQLDAHMLYFVLAALMIAYCCWATLLTACLHTAVQHFTFNLLLPVYLYPGGADWVRFVYHAIILITQMVGSGYLAIQFHRLFSLSHRTVNELRATSAEAAEIRHREDQQRTVAQAERENARALTLEAAKRQQLVVDQIAAGLDNLAHGALDFRIVTAFSAEYEKLRMNFNAAMDRIGDALSRVADNTGAIRSGTGEMSSTAEDLSRRAEQQSQSLQQTVASLDEVTNALNKTANSASNARDVVAAAQGDAEKGTQVVGEAIGAMSGIEQSSKQIGQIIGVIDEIAFQTNLLALNAGVEAARAGDSGRGFAVVASEVRGLAQRSTDAAKQIKTLISASSHQVEQGVVLVRRTGEALQRIVAEIDKINSTVEEIAGSTREQSSSLGVINAAVNDIDSGVRTSADMFETSAEATRRLADQATELEQMLGFFHTGRGPAALRQDRAYAAPQGRRRSA